MTLTISTSLEEMLQALPQEERLRWLELLPAMKEEEKEVLRQILLERNTIDESVQDLNITIDAIADPYVPRVTAEEIARWTADDYRNPLQLHRFRVSIAQYTAELESSAAHDFVLGMTQSFAKVSSSLQSEPALYRAYQDGLLLMRWVGFDGERDEQKGELIREHLMVALESGINVREKVHTVLSLFDDDLLGGVLRKLLLQALRNNQELIPVLTGVQVPAKTVQRWLIDYDAVTGLNKRRTELERITYLDTSPEIKNLPKVSRSYLLQVLELYDLLRFQEVTPLTLKMLQRKPTKSVGVLREESSKGAVDNLLIKYEQWTKEATVAEALARLVQAPVKAAPGAAGRRLGEWLEAVNKKDAQEVMVGLWRLARTGKVREAFGSSARYKEYWGKHLPPQFADRREEFEKDSAAPLFLLLFLRHVLEERLKLTEESAKLVVLTLSNECRKAGEEEYAHLAYGDLATGEFRWNS